MSKYNSLYQVILKIEDYIIKDILTFEDLLNQTIENGAEIIDFSKS